MGEQSSPSCESDGVFTFHYEANGDTQPVNAIVRAVAWVTGTEPTGLKPLHHIVDTDEMALFFSSAPSESILFRSGSEDPDPARSARFQYEGCYVEVTPESVRVLPF